MKKKLFFNFLERFSENAIRDKLFKKDTTKVEEKDIKVNIPRNSIC